MWLQVMSKLRQKHLPIGASGPAPGQLLANLPLRTASSFTRFVVAKKNSWHLMYVSTQPVIRAVRRRRCMQLLTCVLAQRQEWRYAICDQLFDACHGASPMVVWEEGRPPVADAAVAALMLLLRHASPSLCSACSARCNISAGYLPPACYRVPGTGASTDSTSVLHHLGQRWERRRHAVEVLKCVV